MKTPRNYDISDMREKVLSRPKNEALRLVYEWAKKGDIGLKGFMSLLESITNQQKEK
jgi:hypothetical protein